MLYNYTNGYIILQLNHKYFISGLCQTVWCPNSTWKEKHGQRLEPPWEKSKEPLKVQQ